MDTENKPSDKPKIAQELSDAAIKPKTIEEQNEEKPVKKVKRKASQEELDHPLHGVKLAELLESLVAHYGWAYLAKEVNIRCFMYRPNMKASLAFLRKMTWAREHVEDIYMDMVKSGIDPKRNSNKK
jgi:uncharacterized protein (DUF2132 family)